MSRYVVFALLYAATSVHGSGATSSSALKKRTPTSQDFATLNSTVGGKLYAGVPWSQPCFSSYNSEAVAPNSTACAFVQQNFFNSHLVRSDAFGGYGPINWETCMATGDQCELNWMNPTDVSAFSTPQDCKQGSISDYYIDVRSASDVSAAFQFAKTKDIPLIIKNSGHDFQGRASGPGSLALWVHNLKSITHDANFVPQGCSVAGQSALTIGSGSQFSEIYQFAHDNGLIFVGGSDQAVTGTGGWGQGGGHSSLSRAYGMGVDRTLQYKVVTPDGVLRIANKCQNSDLFWALRGGGGSTFGVVIEGTMQASPDVPFQVANVNWPAGDVNVTKQILSVFVDNATTWATQKWGGYLTPPSGNLIMITPQLNTEQAQASVKAISDLATQLGGTAKVEQIPSFFSWFQGWVQGTYGAQDAVGLPQAITSRVIPQSNHATAAGRSQVLGGLMDVLSNSFFQQIHFSTPFGFNATSAADTSVNPAWRSTLYQVLAVNTWASTSALADRQAAFAASTKAMATLRSITPKGFAYHNEADIHEPNWQTTFWGSNYNKLLAIKQKYDPNQLLDCWHCVGWTGSNNDRYKCYI